MAGELDWSGLSSTWPTLIPVSVRQPDWTAEREHGHDPSCVELHSGPDRVSRRPEVEPLGRPAPRQRVKSCPDSVDTVRIVSPRRTPARLRPLTRTPRRGSAATGREWCAPAASATCGVCPTARGPAISTPPAAATAAAASASPAAIRGRRR